MTAVADALELERVDSHLHPVGSFDLADHPVPNGREEVWRFTPLKRLRGLHDEAVLTGTDFDVKVEAPEGVVAHSVPSAGSERGASGSNRPRSRRVGVNRQASSRPVGTGKSVI